MKKNFTDEEDVTEILDLLSELYPNAECELNFANSFELLIATILSAQTTDKKVNQVTANLFKEYKNPEDFTKLSQEELEEKIKFIGLQKNKSKNILATCNILVDKYNGRVPQERKPLESLPGVGRKTANVVMSNAFGIPAIAVDTHVFRVANRIGLAKSKNVLETERQLMDKIPEVLWTYTHHALIWHGRRVCTARNPKCTDCLLLPYCNYGKENNY